MELNLGNDRSFKIDFKTMCLLVFLAVFFGSIIGGSSEVTRELIDFGKQLALERVSESPNSDNGASAPVI